MSDGQEHVIRSVVAGVAVGTALVLSEPLSLWGGLDSTTGRIIDQQHPDRGRRVTNTVVVMPSGRGSSSASSVLVECIRQGTAPAAFVLRDDDHVLTIGALAALEIYGRTTPIVVAPDDAYRSITTGQFVEIAGGTLTTAPPQKREPVG